MGVRYQYRAVTDLPKLKPEHGPIAIAGASGFVGSWILKELATDPECEWIGLSRGRRTSTTPQIGWRQADLFSLPQLAEALKGARVAIYLVHSMLPSSRLVQGSFADLDLLLADNFVRAAEKSGVEHIIYLGGLIPEEEGQLSAHLSSRREVEEVLRSRSVEVTVLRSGLIYGPGGSSARILLNLVNRLPVMVLPAWTRLQTQSTDVRDVSRAVELCLTEEEFRGGTWDIASHAPMSYRDMILRAAKVLHGREPATLNFPANFIGLSQLWVSLISQTSPRLVNPLLASLKHSMVTRDNALLERLLPEAVAFEESVKDAVDEEGRPARLPATVPRSQKRKELKRARRVRSVQRMSNPAGWSVAEVASAYGKWLTRSSHALVDVRQDSDGTLLFYWRIPRLLMLKLTPSDLTRKPGHRLVYYITGGLLNRAEEDPPGRFEFRLVNDGREVIAAIHEFAPSLPWWLYQNTQARIHLFVMRAFGRYLRRLEEGAVVPE